MIAIPVLLAGTVGAGDQNHQSDMWAPRLASAGLIAEAVWTPPNVGDGALARSRELATSLGVELQIGVSPTPSAAKGAIACLRGSERAAFLAFAAGQGIPVLLDKPTLDDTGSLEQLADVTSATLLPGHHFSSHPGFTRALTAVRGAEIGLLRAVATDLVVASGNGVSPVGELRNHGVYLVDLIRQATGPARVTLQAHGTKMNDAYTFLGRTERDVVVSAHVSRTSSSGNGILRARVRFVGTHGSILVDLASPAMHLHTPMGPRTLLFGEDSVTAHLRRFATIIRSGRAPTSVSDLAILSRALDGIADSAATGNSTSITW